MPSTIDHLYEKHIRPLGQTEHLELLAQLSKDLSTDPKSRGKGSLADLRGLGKEIWGGIDAQEYVNNLRSEWERRFLEGRGGSRWCQPTWT